MVIKRLSCDHPSHNFMPTPVQLPQTSSTATVPCINPKKPPITTWKRGKKLIITSHYTGCLIVIQTKMQKYDPHIAYSFTTKDSIIKCSQPPCSRKHHPGFLFCSSDSQLTFEALGRSVGITFQFTGSVNGASKHRCFMFFFGWKDRF